MAAGIGTLLRWLFARWHYYDYLEPARLRMRDYKVFENEQLSAPWTDYWAWSIRRLAYMKLYGDTAQWLRVSEALQGEAAALVNENVNGVGEPARIFTSIDALKQSVALQGA